MGNISYGADFVITTDASADLTQEQINELGISAVVPIAVNVINHANEVSELTFGNHNYLTPNDFYELQKHAEETTTAAFGPDAYMEIWEPLLQQGFHILHLGITEAMSSGAVQSAELAKRELKEIYGPNQLIFLPDTHAVSGGLGLLIKTLIVKIRKDNLDLIESMSLAEELAGQINHWFTVNSLEHLAHTGRTAKKLTGNSSKRYVNEVVKTRPLLGLPYDGRLEFYEIRKGKKSILRRMAIILSQDIKNPRDDVWICYGGDSQKESAKTLAEQIRRYAPKVGIHYHRIGPVIGAHTGPTVIAVFFIGKERRSPSRDI